MESLQGPFVNFGNQTALLLMAERGGPFLSGYIGDPIVGDVRSSMPPSPDLRRDRVRRATQKPQRLWFPLQDSAELLHGHNGKQMVVEK